MKTLAFYILCICLFLTGPVAGVVNADHRKNVLIIHSYHRGFTWTDEIDAALRKVLETDPEIEITSEYLDSKRQPLEKVALPFLRLIESKFRHRLPDAVIVSDNNALTFMRTYYDRHFEGVPLIFCGINNFTPELVSAFGNKVTGVVEKTDPGGTVDLIKNLQPDLGNLVIVTGTSPTAWAIKIETETVLSGREKELAMVWKNGLASRELFQYLETLSPRDAVLLIAFTRDRDGHYYTYEDSATIISRQSPAPVYGLWDFYLDTGIVGGNMVSSRDQGNTAGKLCLEVLRTGRIPPIVRDSPNALLIDYNALNAHGLKASDLPPDAVVINRPVSFYEANKPIIWAVSGFISILIFLVIVLAANIASRRESDTKYQNLFESSMDAIFLIRPDLIIFDCNPAALKLFRIPTRDAFINMNPVDLSPAVQPDGIPSAQKAEKMMAMTMEHNRHFFEWRHTRSDGGEFDASVLLSRTIIGGKSIIQATVRDISDQKQAQEMLIQSEKMMSVGGLAAGMAHEINNPLAGMIQSASVLSNRITQMDMPANRKAAEAAGTTMEAVVRFMELRKIPKMVAAITESGARIAAIVENMLSFARKGDAQFSSHHPAELLDKVLELAATDFDLKKHYDFKNIVIERHYAPDLPVVACEGSKIQQVLLNILKNGAQAMAEHPKDAPPTFILRLDHEKRAGMVRIEIEDNGPGMDRQTRQRIFEPFFTTKPTGVGTGLGLSVSYFIITDNHKGTMTVSSKPGRGAVFTIRLPLTCPART